MTARERGVLIQYLSTVGRRLNFRIVVRTSSHLMTASGLATVRSRPRIPMCPNRCLALNVLVIRSSLGGVRLTSLTGQSRVISALRDIHFFFEVPRAYLILVWRPSFTLLVLCPLHRLCPTT